MKNAFEDYFHGTCNDNNKPLHHMFQYILCVHWLTVCVVRICIFLLKVIYSNTNDKDQDLKGITQFLEKTPSHVSIPPNQNGAMVKDA